MARRSTRIAPFLLTIAWGICWAAGKPAIRSASDLDAFLDRYYLEPHPELVAPAIEYLGASGALKKESAVPPIYAFFAELFVKNAARMPEWSAVVQRQPEEVRTTLGRAVSQAAKSKGPLDGESPSPRRNDMCWGAFYASGSRQYLAQLVEQVRAMGEREDLNRFMSAGTAKWSLASNAQRHPVVKAYVKEQRATATGAFAQQLDEILTTAPEAIQQEIVRVVREQHDKGKW